MNSMKKPVIGLLIMMFMTIVLGTSCSQKYGDHRGVLSIRQNLDDYEAYTTAYEEQINFELSSEEIENMSLPLNIATIYNTTFSITELAKKNDSITMKIGLKYNYQSPEGRMLSLFHLNDDNTYTSSGDIIKVFDDTGQKVAVSRGSGDGKKYGYEQWISVKIPKDLITNNEKLSFSISGINVLSYKEK